MAKLINIILDCGLEAKTWKYKDTEYIEISLFDLYNGYGTFSDFEKVSEIFTELKNKKYINKGISFVTGYYDSVEDVVLRAHKI